MAFTHVAPSAKDGGGSAITGGIRQADTSGAGTGPNMPLVGIEDSAGAEILGTKTDAANTATNGTALSFMQVFKQISASIQGAASSLAGTLTVGTHAVTGSGNFAGTNAASSQADGHSVTLGAKADAAATNTDTTAISMMSVFKQISKTLQAAAGAVGTAFFSKITDGTNTATVKAVSTAPVTATDSALVTVLRPDSAGVIPTASPGTLSASGPSVTAVNPSNYKTVAASSTATVLGATGATGDFVNGMLVVPATTSPGNVLLLDNATSITVFTGGASSVSNLVPFFIPLGATSVSGAWKVTTGTNVSVFAVGKFT